MSLEIERQGSAPSPCSHVWFAATPAWHVLPEAACTKRRVSPQLAHVHAGFPHQCSLFLPVPCQGRTGTKVPSHEEQLGVDRNPHQPISPSLPPETVIASNLAFFFTFLIILSKLIKGGKHSPNKNINIQASPL